MTKGSYGLVLRLIEPYRIDVGKLGAFSFPAGYYVYLGSALGGLEHRLARHLKRDKILRWHVDYLREFAEVDQIWSAAGDERRECQWMAMVSELPEAQLIVPGFGASDCRCQTHLVYFANRPDLSVLGAKLHGDLDHEWAVGVRAGQRKS